MWSDAKGHGTEGGALSIDLLPSDEATCAAQTVGSHEILDPRLLVLVVLENALERPFEHL